MSGVSDPSRASASFSPSQLRHLLEQALPNDSELDAFCIDYIPAVHRQFSAGMERMRKLNLLLLSVSPEELHEYLRCYKARVAGRDERAQPTPSFPGTNTTRWWRNLPVGLGCAAVGSLAMAVFANGLHGLYNRSRSSESAVSGRALSAPTNVDSPVAGTVPWLTSEPASALVFAVPSGRPLGRTPWTPEQAIPSPLRKGSLQVCLRSPGFIPALVKLEPTADPFRPRSIHVRLQREPRAGTQRDLGQETCNVPTPIIE